MGWKDLESYDSSFYDTPNLDKLASEGMRFTDAYAAGQVCSPTRASIMAWKYPARMNTTQYFGGPQPEGVDNRWTKNLPLLPASYKAKLPLSETTIAEALKKEGYNTQYLGKWHLEAKDIIRRIKVLMSILVDTGAVFRDALMIINRKKIYG